MNKMKIGWSEVDITPAKKASLAGQFAERISEYVEKPITVTAFAVEAGDDQMVLCGAEVLHVPALVLEMIRDRLAGNDAGLDPMKVVVSATHIHTAPGLIGSHTQYRKHTFNGRQFVLDLLPEGRKYVESAPIKDNPEVVTAREYSEFFADQVAKAALEAWANRKEGGFTNSFGRAPVGMCRRAVYSDGSAQMWGDTNTAVFTELEGGNDSGIELLFVFNAERQVTGVVANIACPAQCVQHRLFISPDYWGEVKVRLREYFGKDLFLLPLCSAAGDQCPVDLVRWVEPENDVHDPTMTRSDPPKRKADPSMFDLAGMRKAGKRVAREIIDIYEEGLGDMECAPVFEHRVKMMQLPLRRVTMAERDRAVEKIKEYLRENDGDINYSTMAKLQVHLGMVRRFDLQEKMDVLKTEVHVIRMGNIAFASNPFELFLDFGNQIRARSLAEQTFLIQLANGSEGYLPTEKAEQGGHYSAFVDSGQVGHVGGEQLVRETLTEIREMFAGR